jgi:hypothetical protein
LEAWIASTTSVVLAASAAAGAIIAGVGLAAWRQELPGRADFHTARRVMQAVYELRNEFRHVRNVFSPGSPETHYERLNDKASQLDVVLLEAEVLWGSELQEPKQAIKECLSTWRTQLRKCVRNFNEELELSEPDYQQMAAVLSGDEDDDDDFGQRVRRAVCQFDDVLRRYLNRTNRNKAGRNATVRGATSQ